MASVCSPCAACKFLRRKCASDCIFAPYFPPDQTQKFINLHKMYGTSNVQKLLAKLPVDQRQDAVNSLAFEAEARLLDPVYGCVGPIVALHHRVTNMKGVLQDAYKELASYQDAVLQAQQAMGVAGFQAAQPTPDMMHPLGVNPLSESSSSEPYKMASMMGIPTRGSSLEIREPGPQSNNNNTTFHPKQLSMLTATVEREQQPEIIKAFEFQKHGQDIRFDRGRGFIDGAESNTGVGVGGFSINDPDPQSNNNNNTPHPEQLVMPIATVGMEQQEIIRAFELQQHGKDIRFDMGQGFNVGAGSNTGVEDVGYSLNEPISQSNNNNNSLHPEQLVMPVATVGMEQQETITALELQQHEQDIWFDGGQGLNVGKENSTGVRVVGFSVNEPGPQSENNTTLHPEQLVMPIAPVGTEQQETIRAFELQQHWQDIWFDGGQGFNVGEGSNTGVEVVGFSLNDAGPQSNDKNNTLNPEQLIMSIAALGMEQQETIRAFELQQHGQDLWFDGGRDFNVGKESSTGVGVVGISVNEPNPQSENNNTLHPEQLVMPIATVGTEQQETITAFELQQHEQDIWFDGGGGFNVGEGSSIGVEVVGISINDSGPQSNNNNTTLNPEQLVMSIATVGVEQQEAIRTFELQQHGQDLWVDAGRGWNVGKESSTGVGVVGFSLNEPGPQSENNNTLHPEQLVMPIAPVGTEQQETIRAFELQQHEQDIWFNGAQGFNVGEGSSTGVEVVGFSLRDAGRQSNNNNTTFNPEQLVMSFAAVGMEQQETIRAVELQQRGQGLWFDGGRDFNVGKESSTGVGVVGISVNEPDPQNENNTTLNPEQLVMPIATVGTEQQETITAFELQQHEQDIWFDGGRGFNVGKGSSIGVEVVGISLKDSGPQSNNNNTALNPEQLVMPIAPVGTEQQETIRAFELQQHEQDVWFDGGQGFNVGEGSSTGVEVVGFSLRDAGPQSNNNNNTFNPEHLVMSFATVGMEQQETIRAFELQQNGPDLWFDGGRGLNVEKESSTGVRVVGISLNEPGRQSENNNTLHPEQLVMPIATAGMEQQETIRAFELQQHGQDIWFDGGRGFNVGEGSSTGVEVVGISLNDPRPQSNNNNTTLHPDHLVMPIATVGTEQQQEIISSFELQQHGQDLRFDWGQVFDDGTGSSSAVGVVGFGLNDPGPQSHNNNTLHPDQLVMPIATVGTEQHQEIIRAFELQQHGQDLRFDWGQGFDVGTGSSSGVGLVGLGLNDPGSQSNNNYNTLHPEQLVMPIATVGTEQQESIRDFELQQHGQDIRFDVGRGFNIGEGSSTGDGVLEFSLNNPPSPLLGFPNPMMGSFESGYSHPHFQPQLSLQPQQVVAVQEPNTQELESQEERLQGLNFSNDEAEPSSSFYYVNR